MNYQNLDETFKRHKKLLFEHLNLGEDKFHTNLPEVSQIGLAAFPDYRGKKFSVDVFKGPMRLDSYWDGGSKNSFAAVDLETLRAGAVPENYNMGAEVLPNNIAIVKHTIFSGKDLGLTIYVNATNISKSLPQPTDELSWAENVVLVATRSLKSSYGGISNYRFYDANRTVDITKEEWDTARESLIQKGLLNKSGALTNNGRNSASFDKYPSLWALKKNTQSEKPNELEPSTDQPQIPNQT